MISCIGWIAVATSKNSLKIVGNVVALTENVKKKQNCVVTAHVMLGKRTVCRVPPIVLVVRAKSASLELAKQPTLVAMESVKQAPKTVPLAPKIVSVKMDKSVKQENVKHRSPVATELVKPQKVKIV